MQAAEAAIFVCAGTILLGLQTISAITVADAATNKCLQDSLRTPVLEVAHKGFVTSRGSTADGRSSPPELRGGLDFGAQVTTWAEQLGACYRGGGRAFWVLGVFGEGYTHDAGAQLTCDRPFVVGTRSGICVPASCQEASVGQYFAAFAVDLTASVPQHMPRPLWGHAGFRRSIWRTGFPLSHLCNGTTVIFPLNHAYALHLEPPSRHPLWERIVLVVEDAVDVVPVPATRSFQQPSNGVAACFGGHWRIDKSVADTVRMHLIDPLRAQVFGVFSGGISPYDREIGYMHEVFPSTRSVSFIEDVGRSALVTMLNESGRLAFYLSSAAGALSPVVGGDFQLHLYRKQSLCLDLVADYEAARQARYARVVFSRLDLVWAAEHPPLHLLSPEKVWIPCTSLKFECSTDAGGFDDNHAVMNRAHAEVYMRRWELLLQGRAQLVPYATGHMLLKILLTIQFNISVGRFPAVAGLSCCRRTWRCTHGSHGNCSLDGRFRQQALSDIVQRWSSLLHMGATWQPTQPSARTVLEVQPIRRSEGDSAV